jgi:TonB family protein
MNFRHFVASAVTLCCLSFAAIAQDKSRPATPIDSEGAWFPPDAYPVEARRAGEQGKVGVELDVDAFGKAIACRIASGSGSAALDKGTCDVALRNARLNPALDKNGRPVASIYRSRNVVWRIDGGPRPMDVSGGAQMEVGFTAIYEVNSDGLATSCKNVNTLPVGQNVCDNFVVGTRILPPLASNGKPVSAKVTIRSSRSTRIEPAQ